MLNFKKSDLQINPADPQISFMIWSQGRALRKILKGINRGFNWRFRRLITISDFFEL
jgi:hypothetical protein